MVDVFICRAGFSAAAALDDILLRRRIAVQSDAAPQSPIASTPVASAQKAGQTLHTLVCSAVFEQETGGRPALTEIARGKGARRIVIVKENDDNLAIENEMGGRLLRVSMPPRKTTRPAVLDSALLMLAEIVASPIGAMVAADEKSGRLVDLAIRVAKSDVTVFINGPTGCGKEVLARKIHLASRRADKPFIAINCAAIPENMLEAILFGHEKGAFTGASTANSGIIRAAEGGTLLLDEVSEMPMGLQAKLLRVLQERTVTPLGSQKEIPVDIRVIATSNLNMAQEVAQRRFREDLYYRLNVFPLVVPALAERRDDIVALAVALILRHHQDAAAPPLLCDDAIDQLMSHDWPGNVRELENVVQRALVFQQGGRITGCDIIFDSGSTLARPIPCADAAFARLAVAL